MTKYKRARSKPIPDKDGYPSIDWLLDTYIIEEETGKLLYKEAYDSKGRRSKRSLTEVGWSQRTNVSKSYVYKAIEFNYNNGEKKRTRVSRVVWAMTYGYWPKLEIDHIDGNPLNNRIDNLREVDHVTNGRNQRTPTNNTTGVCGVYRYRTGDKWVAAIKVNYKKIHLGLFDTIEEAAAARKEAEIKYGFHENHGRENPDAKD